MIVSFYSLIQNKYFNYTYTLNNLAICIPLRIITANNKGGGSSEAVGNTEGIYQTLFYVYFISNCSL